MERPERAENNVLWTSDYPIVRLELAAMRGCWRVRGGWSFTERFAGAQGIVFGTLCGCCMWLSFGLALVALHSL